MVHFCCVPGCSNRSDRETNLSFFGLPLKNKGLLKQWIHVIGRKTLPVNSSTKVCSMHFKNAEGRYLYANEVPSKNLPKIMTSNSENKQARKSPKQRHVAQIEDHSDDDANSMPSDHILTYQSISTQTDLTMTNGSEFEVVHLKERIAELESKLQNSPPTSFRLSSMKDDESKVLFYTGFPSYSSLKAFYDFLGPSVNQLTYSKKQVDLGKEKTCSYRPRSLPPIEEMFLTLVRLRVGLMEQDLGYRFNISQPTVSRITCTWINFLYHKLKEIPIWPPRELVQANMPPQFKKLYPSTRVILDATEIYIEQPHLPELHQMTFSNYKNDNTFKALIGISPDGVITFVSSLFSGSISDKALTRKSGILDLLQHGDSVMADRGFDIEEDLMLRGVRLNIPPFLQGKEQLDERDLITTRRIASLRIHVERAMERIKNFHIFDRSIPASLTDIADRIFFICCVLSNFHPPLV